MKSHIHSYLIPLAALALAAACTQKEPTDKEILDGRISASELLEVSYHAGGAEVRSLSLPHTAVRQELDVTVNNDNLNWNIESDSPWCTVVPAEHKGSGKVTLEIAVNESFQNREPATLTFVAGGFRGFPVTVNQNASAFILSQPYFTAPREGDHFYTDVTTPEGTDFSVNATPWLSVTRGESHTEGGLTITPLEIVPSGNTDASRYGAVTLTSGSETESVWVYQFGNDFEYSESGDIILPGDAEASFSFTAPAFVVKSVETPAFAHVSVTENSDGTATLSVQLDRNLSDCGESREVDLSLLLANGAASVVELPTVLQDYVPANGLVTGKGLLAFAKAVAEGTSTSDWEKDGVVTVLQDIDMAGIEDWPGIGTKAQPFTGKFNGGGFAVTNLKKAPVGLFGYCKGASIQDISLGKGSSLYNNKEYADRSGGSLGGVVSCAEGTSVSGCGMNGDLEFAGTSDDDAPAYVGGIVGWADKASTVTRGKMGGKIVISIPSASETTCYAGGIAGLCEGTLTASEITGRISFSSGVGTIIAGGIQGALEKDATSTNNSFMGTLTLGGSSSHVYLGGLFGIVRSDYTLDSATDKSVSLGNINIDAFGSSTTANVFAGGVIGKAEPGINLSVKGFEFQTNISLDQTVNRQASYICLGGVLGGCDPDEACASVSFENITNLGNWATAYNTTVVTSQISRCFVGGIAGLVNGKSTFKSCTNNGEIGKLASGANSANTKNYVFVLGGIAGVVTGGDASFTGCENKGPVTNKHYSNCIPDNNREGWYTACTAAGILGAFDFKPESDGGKLTMNGCVNGSPIVSYRGMAGGILGFARNAEISSCNNFGDLGQNSTNSSNAAFKGGIAAWLSQATVSDCISKCNVFCSNPASAVQSPAGIVSVAYAGVSVKGCSYFGALSVNNGDGDKACGGVVSSAVDDTRVESCRFGGRVNGIDISENNVASFAVGNESGKVSDITLWNGNL